MKWDPQLRNYVKELDSKKPVILSGDMNVSHQPIGMCIISHLSRLRHVNRNKPDCLQHCWRGDINSLERNRISDTVETYACVP